MNTPTPSKEEVAESSGVHKKGALHATESRDGETDAAQHFHQSKKGRHSLRSGSGHLIHEEPARA